MKTIRVRRKKGLSGTKPRALLLAALMIPVGITWQIAVKKSPQGQFEPNPGDVISPKGLPSIGKWMISPRLSYSDWLGTVYNGKRLREPINVIIVDPFAESEDDASRRLLEACARAGFPSRPGHSGGYFGWLNDRLCPQIPAREHHAVSDEPFELHNNHGRFFGPCLWAGRHYFVGAFSREKLVPATKAEHQYVSFNQARDRFARGLAKQGVFEMTGFVNLDNALMNDPALSTGDHDGIGVVLTAIR
jgi:hypothetical protein